MFLPIALILVLQFAFATKQNTSTPEAIVETCFEFLKSHEVFFETTKIKKSTAKTTTTHRSSETDGTTTIISIAQDSQSTAQVSGSGTAVRT